MRSFECRRVQDVAFGPGGLLYLELDYEAGYLDTRQVVLVKPDFAGKVDKNYPCRHRCVSRPYLIECDHSDPAGGHLKQLLVMIDQTTGTFRRYDPHRMARLDYPPLRVAPLDGGQRRKVHLDNLCRDFGRVGCSVTSHGTTKLLNPEFGYVDGYTEFDFAFGEDEIWVASRPQFSDTGVAELDSRRGRLVRLVTDGTGDVRGGWVHQTKYAAGIYYRRTHDGFFYREPRQPGLYWRFGDSEPAEVRVPPAHELLHCLGARMMTVKNRTRTVTISALDGSDPRSYEFAARGQVYGGRFSADGLTAVFWTGERVYQFDLE